MKVIDQINESGIFAQSAYSAEVATKDSSGREITATYLTDVPAGTLNESGFEYDNSNKISGYNGSAFAGQGGTEYSGVDPIVVNNNEHKISATTWDLAIGDGLSAFEDTANNQTIISVTGGGGGGAEYSGIDPIVVNNMEHKISANASTLVLGEGLSAVNDTTNHTTTLNVTGYQAAGDYISANGFSQHITNTGNNKYLSFWNEAGGSTATAYPAIYLNGQFGSAYYKDNELKLGRNGHSIAFNIGGAGPKISAAATGTTDSLLYVYNTGNSATVSQSGFNLKNSTADENVTIDSIRSWNAKGDMHESAFAYDGNNNITAYNGSGFGGSQVVTSTAGNANYVNKINGKGLSATITYKARFDEAGYSISSCRNTVNTNSANWQTITDLYDLVNTNSANWGSTGTVLWSGTATAGITLRQPITDFSNVCVVYGRAGNSKEDYFDVSRSGDGISLSLAATFSNQYASIYSQSWKFENSTSFTTAQVAKEWWGKDSAVSSRNTENMTIYKVIGFNQPGVNVSHGPDETLLWSGLLNAPSAIQLSEQTNHFDRIKMYFTHQNGYKEIKEYDGVASTFALSMTTPYAANRAATIIRYAYLSSTDYTNYNYALPARVLMTTGANNYTSLDNAGPHITRIVGINRKS